ncbi:MAG: hypothetical protein A2927_02805 [Candidatus Komeilibacteria bacterium RIFCSPLOWO2_01_FULL_45_10]|uniref:Isoleucine--tRNA ligase n=1 Tax=Candidatus Komeilibacteria bacterium RIFCSPLOWO2_01_FULL_45_10 TaxID=1798550 RepID=A0A1G2BHY6_9BACT|nr:MAG: hypothetical protein A2927_02805 [Candidatus Komeilibacteria bacterium RIFCSPLOWO2_01_FULL_45_10]
MLNFPSIEEKILKYWQEKDIFQKTLAKESPKGDFVFYDGPPFATGLPHYGHIVASLMKDIVPRYWTMQGYHVERKWGWDCHGLPIENIVEKELGLKRKKDIEEYGVDKFNQSCHGKVLLFAEEWKKTIRRMGRWVDMENDYKTMDKTYMESIWWVFKQLWDKDLIYEGYRSIHICPRCETTLSQSEVGQNYQDVKDFSATVKFELVDEPGTYVLSWTTTPWTLPGNAALADGEEIEYVKISSSLPPLNLPLNKGEKQRGSGGARGGSTYILAKAIFEQWPNKDQYEIIKEFKGKELIGKQYRPLFDYFDNDKLENYKNAFKIYAADFVSTEEGTGVVHIAPGFGEDDFNLSQEEDLPIIKHVDMSGRFTEEVVDFAGEEVKPKGEPTAVDKKVVNWLEQNGKLFASAVYEHSYPHCWRCDSPLLNYTTNSWFVAVEKIKKDLLKNAKKINWVPSHIKEGRFGKWLEGARDWSISRQRYWGSVMPIWVCDQCGEKKVFGSVKDLEEASGQKVEDLHKHIVDGISVPCEKCQGTMKRIPDVLDCWFESGSMPYAQMHYPFQNKDKFEQNFPAEFIAEGADQTRTWFYYLHVLATALKDKRAFNNVIVNGIVLAEDGKKMSKKLQNYPDPEDIFKKYGADAMRYYLATSPVMKADDLNFSEKDVAIVYKKVFLILGNVLSFYKMYEHSGTEPGKDSQHILDKWILAKTKNLKREITEAYDSYDLVNAARPLADFINELSTWYLRRSRERFKGDDESDKQAAKSTLKYVLENLALLMAPVMPFTADWLYQELGGEKESVHLEAWPKSKEARKQRSIGQRPISLWLKKAIKEMEVVRKIVELALAKRDEAGIKVRQALNQLTVKGAALSDELAQLIKDEVNVKNVVFEKGDNLSVELDIALTDELKEEGMYRELVRTINQLRKEAGLTINDKITVYYQSDSALLEKVIGQFKTELLKNTIANEIKAMSGKISPALIEKDVEINSEKIKLYLLDRNQG